ncbi:MAG TPA: hypothetical protein VF945_10430, partial [Polyangia bacterium]
IHAWDEPAETLIAQAPARGVHLVMPRLGAAVEPARVERVEPWWRDVRERGDARERDDVRTRDAAVSATGEPLVEAIGEPID